MVDGLPERPELPGPDLRESSGKSNFGYTNEDASALMAEGNSAAFLEAGPGLYNEAADLILDDMPVIPMWFGRTLGAYNENVANVSMDKFGNLNFVEVTLSD